MKDLKAKNPLVIYIAETDHRDMSYSSLLKQVIEDCDSRGLNTKVFSEFQNQTEKVETQSWTENKDDEKISSIDRQLKNLINVPSKEIHIQTTKFLDEVLIPMGNVFERFTKLIPSVKNSLSEDITPSKLFEERRGDIDNPESIKLLEAEIAIRKENEKNRSGEVGSRDSAGKDGEDFKKFWRNGNVFVHKTAHQEMARDVMRGINGDEDVVVMIAGAAHIYGLNQELAGQFGGCKKLVLGNFREIEVDFHNIKSLDEAGCFIGKESCQKVGNLVGFEINEDKQAMVPQIITREILNQVSEKKSDLKELEETKKSWAERIRNEGEKTKGGVNEI